MASALARLQPRWSESACHNHFHSLESPAYRPSPILFISYQSHDENRIIALLCSLWVISMGLFALPAMAKNKADLADIELERERGNLEVSFRIQDCFTPKMEEAIRSGVSTTFRILVVLEKPGVLPGIPLLLPLPFAFLQPRIIFDQVLEHTIKYDWLKNEYRVQLPEHPERVLVTKDFDEAKRWMSVQDLPLIPLWRLEKDQVYRLRIKAELSK